MGKTGETCGAVTGALMIISLKHGATDVNNSAAKEKTYNLAGKFIKKFEARNNSAMCRDLLGFDISDNSYPDKNKIISEKCPKYIKDAAGIIEEMLRS